MQSIRRLGCRGALSLSWGIAAAGLFGVLGNSSAHAQVCAGYSITNTTGTGQAGTFVPGTDDTGNHCDDCVTPITLPFNVNFYGTVYNSASVGSNGTFQFVTSNIAYANVCFPAGGIQTGFGPTIFPFWDDLYTTDTAGGQGVFTNLSGTSPNQVFVVEWRTVYCCGNGAPINDFEIKFYENQGYFDIIFSPTMADRASATIGIQDGAGQFVQYECNVAGPTPGTSLRVNCLSSSTAGACCNPVAGTCAIANQADCTPAANFRGVGTACPSTCPASGACCNNTSSGCTLTGAAGCGAGSTFQGTGSVCNPTPCPAPLNDNCSDVVTANAPRIPGAGGTVTGNTLTATTDGAASCGSSGFNDVYFLFTPATNNAWTFSMCATNPTFDSMISVHSGCPADTSTQVTGGCNDDSCGLLSQLTVGGLSVGTQYIVRVSTYSNASGAGGNFTLAVTAAQIGACCNTTTGACTNSTTGAAGCAGGTTYLGDNTTCDTTTPFTVCGQGACCNPVSGSCTLSATAGCASPNVFQSAGTSCTPNPCPQPPPPSNDDCSGATALTLGTPRTGSITGATGNAITGGCTGSSIDVWHTFTAPTNGGYTVTTVPGSATDAATAITAGTVCPVNSNADYIACSAQPGNGATNTVSFNGTAGTQYFIRLGAFPGNTGSYTVTITAFVTGACCDTSNGACTVVAPANCNTGTSTYSGDNTSCPSSNLCPGLGTCCSPAGNCSVQYSGSCPAGLTSNSATSCSPTLCSPSAGTVCENFDSGTVGSLPSNWSSTSTGAGTAWAIDSTQSYSAPNAVFSNDPATVSSQFLVLPTVTVGASGMVTVDFFSYFDTEPTFDGFVVEFSTDGGNNWTDLVNSGSWSLNGYNQAAISTAFQSPIAGRPAFSGVFTSWVEHIGVINATAGQQMMIRFQMASDNSVNHVGVWLDNICVNAGGSSGGSGVCCRGSTCNTSVTQANCRGSSLAGAAFISSTGTCNTATNTISPCCQADYNKVNHITVQDIFDFLNDWFAGNPYTRFGSDGSPALLAVQNIFDFLNAWFAGGCS